MVHEHVWILGLCFKLYPQNKNSCQAVLHLRRR